MQQPFVHCVGLMRIHHVGRAKAIVEWFVCIASFVFCHLSESDRVPSYPDPAAVGLWQDIGFHESLFCQRKRNFFFFFYFILRGQNRGRWMRDRELSLKFEFHTLAMAATSTQHTYVVIGANY